MVFDDSLIPEPGWVENRLTRLGEKTIYLYGAGGFGREMLAFLQSRAVPVSGFLDRRADALGEYCGLPVYRLDTAPPSAKASMVLFCIVMDGEERRGVLRQIREAGFPDVQEAQFFRSLLVTPEHDEGTGRKAYFTENRPRIEEAFQFLADEKSRGIYMANLKAHFLRDYADCSMYEDPMEEQYFPADVSLGRGYQRFVDCGAYIGDTLARLKRKGCTVESAAAFEPDLRNFSRMSALCRAQGIQADCFPCAVSDRTAILRFSAAQGSGSVCETGEDVALSVSLDEALNGWKPTFLKMDIEGEELNALRGAKQLICENTPDLAVCVYHRVNHLWDILLLLRSWNLGYRFYLRSYNAYTMETVLYAAANVPPKGRENK